MTQVLGSSGEDGWGLGSDPPLPEEGAPRATLGCAGGRCPEGRCQDAVLPRARCSPGPHGAGKGALRPGGPIRVCVCGTVHLAVPEGEGLSTEPPSPLRLAQGLAQTQPVHVPFRRAQVHPLLCPCLQTTNRSWGPGGVRGLFRPHARRSPRPEGGGAGGGPGAAAVGAPCRAGRGRGARTRRRGRRERGGRAGGRERYKRRERARRRRPARSEAAARLCGAPRVDEDGPGRAPALAAEAQTPALPLPQPRPPSPGSRRPGRAQPGEDSTRRRPQRAPAASLGGPVRGLPSLGRGASGRPAAGRRGSRGAEGRAAAPLGPPPPPPPSAARRSSKGAAGPASAAPAAGGVCGRPRGCWHLPLLSDAAGLQMGSRGERHPPTPAPRLFAPLFVEKGVRAEGLGRG